MRVTDPRVGSMFSGVGAFDIATLSVLGGEVVWHAEIDPAGCKVLAARWPGVPNLGDVSAVDWAEVEPVDVLTGGFPCSDVSLAGKRLGIGPGTRSGLWAQMARAIAALRPRLVVIENVRGLLSARAVCDVEPCPWCLGDRGGVNQEPVLRACGAVLGDLAELGFDAEGVGLPASGVGACHQRFRVFILAWPAADTAGIGRRTEGRDDGLRAEGLVAEPAADTPGVGRGEGRPEPARLGGGSDAAIGRDGPPADTDGPGRESGAAVAGACGPSAGPRPAVVRAGGCGGAAPDPDGIGSVRGGTARRGRDGPADDGLTAPDPDCGPVRGQPVAEPGGGRAPVAGLDREAPADPGGDGRERHPERDLGPDEPGQPAPFRGDAAGRVLDWGAYGPAIRRWELILGRPAPPPTLTGKRGGQQLSPVFAEWLMGLPEGWVTDVPGVSRNDALRLLGGAVVPQQGAAALRELLARTAVESLGGAA